MTMNPLRTRQEGRDIDPAANGFDRASASKSIEQRLLEIRERGNLTREATVGAVDMAARTVELSFSSETESVERWFGIEVLGHDPAEVDLGRLNNKAPLLWMHKWGDQRGVVESARIDADKVGRAIVRLSRSNEGEQLLQDINDGIITKVSVGYSISGLKLVEERDDVPVYRITSWTPMEISMVSVPADDSVGVGRGAEIPQEEAGSKAGEKGASEGLSTRAGQKEEAPMLKEQQVRDAHGNLVRAMVDDDGKIVEIIQVVEMAVNPEAAARAAGGADERQRVQAISTMGKDYGRADLALEFIREGKTVDAFNQRLLADFASKQVEAAKVDGDVRSEDLGLDAKEVERFSIVRLLRSCMDPNDKTFRDEAAFEHECADAASRQYGAAKNGGVIIPADVLKYRVLNAGGAGNTPVGSNTGAHLIGTSFLADSFIGMLRNRAVLLQLATPLTGLVGNVEIPKQTGAGGWQWVGENQSAGESGPTYGQLALTPKTISAKSKVTRRLLMQASLDVERLIMNEININIAHGIDHAGFYGTGSQYQPLGLKNYDGINDVEFDTLNEPTNGELIDMESNIAADNADFGSIAYVMHTKMRGHMKQTPKFGAGTTATIWESGNMVNSYKTEVTNQVERGDVFFGNFANLIIAMWGGLEILVNPYSNDDTGEVKFTAFQDVDTALRYPEGICLGN